MRFYRMARWQVQHERWARISRYGVYVVLGRHAYVFTWSDKGIR